MRTLSRRDIIRSIGAGTAFAALNPLTSTLLAAKAKVDSLPMQLYRSLSDEQRGKICLPVDHESRQFISNWWYVNPEQRLHTFYTKDQQDLAQQVFDSLHHPEHRMAMTRQVEKDLMGEIKNTPSIGFFGTPEDENFEFIYTGHHVTRRCNTHTDKGLGFGGAPIFYGNFAKAFKEDKDHAGNPFWYQGLLFNEFVSALDGNQQAQILVERDPRAEKPALVIQKRATDLPGLRCAELSEDQQEKLLETMQRMLVVFRPDDVAATMKTIRARKLVNQLFVSSYGGKYDVGSDRVWDTWQIEGPDMVWYFRGTPHIHAYFHLKA